MGASRQNGCTRWVQGGYKVAREARRVQMAVGDTRGMQGSKVGCIGVYKGHKKVHGGGPKASQGGSNRYKVGHKWVQEVTLVHKGMQGYHKWVWGVRDTKECENRKFKVLGTHIGILLSLSGQRLKG